MFIRKRKCPASKCDIVNVLVSLDAHTGLLRGRDNVGKRTSWVVFLFFTDSGDFSAIALKQGGGTKGSVIV